MPKPGPHAGPGRAAAGGTFEFGPFRLIAAERLLLRGGARVAIGARSLDLLIALVERRGEPVSKQALMERVWPGITIDEGGLRVQMAGLRRALGDEDGYVATVPGRGYCFIAVVSQAPAGLHPAHAADPPAPGALLPPRHPGMVGRETEIAEIASHLLTYRFVTILGPGGIGKTTTAIPLAYRLLDTFCGMVRFVDLGPVSDPRLVPSALAATLGLLVQSDDPLATLAAYLRDKRLLLVLDSCEHVIDAAAEAAETIHQHAPDVHLLITSRELLRARGEYAYRLPPLQVPPADVELTAAMAMTFPAIELFVNRVTATEDSYRLTDADTPIVCEICRKLDGIALAIELAAGRVAAFGVEQTARMLEGQFSLQWQARRTALPRHQTLAATLDWSYDLLSEPERLMLRRLSAFSGRFALGAAEAVMTGGAERPGPCGLVLDGLASLVGKSMVSADTRERPTMYRMLDTTRAYAGGKLGGSGELVDVARRHAAYFASFLPSVNERSPGLSKAQNFSLYADHLGNVRAALDFSFGPDGDRAVAVELAAAAARMFLQLSLLTECHHWAALAIASLDGDTEATRRELELQAWLGQSIMFSKGNREQVRAAFLRGLALAEQLGDLAFQLQLLGGLHIFHERIGDFATAMAFARQGLAVAEALGDPGGLAAAHSFLGISLHLEGHHAEAQRHVETALSCDRPARGIHFGFDHRNRARITLARILWVRGRCAEAVKIAESTVQDAIQLGHPVTVCIALIWAVSVHIWSGDWDRAEDGICQFTEHAERHALAPYYAVGSGVRGELAVHHGDAATGVTALQLALTSLHEDRYELLTTAFLCAIGTGQARLGQVGPALGTIDAAIAEVRKNGDRFLLPELLRVRGELLATQTDPDLAQAEDVVRDALALARQHGAVSWELRAAITLVRLLAGHARPDSRTEALAILSDALGRMVDSADTTDFNTARRLIEGCVPHRT